MNNTQHNKPYIIDLYNRPTGWMTSVVIFVLEEIYNDNSYYTSKLILTNINLLKIGSKLLNKKYWRHAGYSGGVKFKFEHNFVVVTTANNIN
ncbi:50S ribosomal protein L13 [Candidatus Hodgkinia cicadicola]|nr:MAG: 50S ribosomal protein L13 [Candidatus Hodgkinia cicadicola]PIM96783.1 50S ribosomal protein L13 [Candidatus Hodgkinia cicadicola]